MTLNIPQQVNRYEYLTNFIFYIDRPTQDIVADNYEYLSDQTRLAMFVQK